MSKCIARQNTVRRHIGDVHRMYHIMLLMQHCRQQSIWAAARSAKIKIHASLDVVNCLSFTLPSNPFDIVDHTEDHSEFHAPVFCAVG